MLAKGGHVSYEGIKGHISLFRAQHDEEVTHKRAALTQHCEVRLKLTGKGNISESFVFQSVLWRLCVSMPRQ